LSNGCIGLTEIGGPLGWSLALPAHWFSSITVSPIEPWIVSKGLISPICSSYNRTTLSEYRTYEATMKLTSYISQGLASYGVQLTDGIVDRKSVV
jgi:hypothetical protein